MKACRALVAMLILALGAACTIGPRVASVRADREAKTFKAPPGRSAIYIYAGASPANFDVTLDDRWEGSLGPTVFLRRVVQPGRHDLFTEGQQAEFTAPVAANLVLTTEPDTAYFIRIDLPVWTAGGRVSSSLVPRDEASREVSKRRLIGWEP